MLVAKASGSLALPRDQSGIGATLMASDPATAAATSAYACMFCDYVYDENLGIPDNGIPAGTAWSDIPEDWCCPDCGATKYDFVIKDY